MNLPPLPLVGGCLLIDNSGFMEGISTCSRYLEYKTIRLRIMTSEKPSLNFGSAIHLALEHRYKKYTNQPVGDQYYNELAEILTNFFNEHPFPAEDWRSLNFCMEMVKKYNERYSSEEFNLLTDKDGNPMVEVAFSLPLFKYVADRTYEGATLHCQGDNGKLVSVIPVIYTGKIDLPISYPSSGVWINDHKTTAAGGQPFWDEQRMSAQHRGYCWSFKELTGIEPVGYQVNMIRTKDTPMYVKANKNFKITQGRDKGKSKTPEDFWNETFQREKFLLKPGELDEWKFNTIDLVEEFFWHYSRGYFPMKTKWCSMFGRCPYYEVCSLAPEDRIPQLNSGNFVNNDWSPLKK